LERKIGESPELFAQAIVLAYNRRDGGEDPDGWRIDDPGRRQSVATAAHRLLSRVLPTAITGDDSEAGVERLAAWVRDVRRLTEETGRREVGDVVLGEFLAKAAPGKDGSWPSEAVCRVIESTASRDLGRGFRIGVYNSRGVHMRIEGGDQE